MHGINWRKLSIMLRPDDGAGTNGGSETTTTNPANTTGGGQVTNTQAGSAGAVTDTVTSQSQAATNTNTNTADTQKPAPKFTDDDMAAAKRAWKAEAQRASDEAARVAQEQEAVEQGKAKEVAATRLQTIHDLEARVARMEPVLTARLDELTKDWPPTILTKKPAEGGYDAHLNWYETYKDVAEDYAKANQTRQQTQAQGYGGTGFQPTSQGAGGNVRPVDNYVKNTYGAPKKQ